MNSWKIISQIASGFGIVFVVFAALEAFVNYQAITMQSAYTIPSGYLQVYILSAMLPFLLFAVLSFIVAAAIMRSGREAEENMPVEQHPVEPEA
ncbi:MAG: hypothetical protein NWF00_04500 [Candidatus Bathyarchaeota archaeon]|nr:hypothetical protein [Candidatus Bathyarchaeota archaeon]